jgi:hypothetical protein
VAALILIIFLGFVTATWLVTNPDPSTAAHSISFQQQVFCIVLFSVLTINVALEAASANNALANHTYVFLY